MRDVRTLETSIARPLAEVYAFLAEPSNYPLWADGLCRAIARVGDRWIATTPEGEAEVRFTPYNPYGVLDHTVVFGGDRAVYVPMRVLANGEGATLTFTLLREPGMTDAAFAADAQAVERDLAKMRALLEAR